MTSRGVNPEYRRKRLRPVSLAVAALAVLVAAGSDARARGGRSERPIEQIQSRSAGEPVMAIVSLRSQRITVYDAKGWILRAPVSSGSKGRETPAGIFSVIQKVEEHYSNLYDDAFMPHMQRITWSGIALHGGVLPGRPASHGCIRLPFDFAAQLFDATKMGIRIIIAPDDVTPLEIAHPLLLQPKPGAAALAAARATEAQEATRKAAEARSGRSGSAAGGDTGQGAGSRGGKPQAQGRGQIGVGREQAGLRHLGGSERAGRGRQDAGGRQSRRAATATGRRQCGSAAASSMPPRPRVTQRPRPKRRGSWRPKRPARSQANCSRYRC